MTLKNTIEPFYNSNTRKYVDCTMVMVKIIFVIAMQVQLVPLIVEYILKEVSNMLISKCMCVCVCVVNILNLNWRIHLFVEYFHLFHVDMVGSSYLFLMAKQFQHIILEY